MSGRRRKERRKAPRTGRHLAGAVPEPVPALPDWIDLGGQRMFVIDLTPGGFPIGQVEESGPSYAE